MFGLDEEASEATKVQLSSRVNLHPVRHHVTTVTNQSLGKTYLWTSCKCKKVLTLTELLMLHFLLKHVQYLDKKMCLRICLDTVMFSSSCFQTFGSFYSYGQKGGVNGRGWIEVFVDSWSELCKGHQSERQQRQENCTSLLHFTNLQVLPPNKLHSLRYKRETGATIISPSSEWQNTFFLTLIVKNKYLGVYGQNSKIASYLSDSFALALSHWWKSTPDSYHPHTFYKPCCMYYHAKVWR